MTKSNDQIVHGVAMHPVVIDCSSRLNRVHDPGPSQLSMTLARLSEIGRQTIRNPHPEVLQVLDKVKDAVTTAHLSLGFL
jgi:hypothetical protein